MKQVDWQKERERLVRLYSNMEDGELKQIGADRRGLTDTAREVLFAEMSTRGLSLPPDSLWIEPPADNANSPKPVVLREYLDLQEATLAKSLLDSAGIENYLLDSNVVRLSWFYSNLVGGIKILVRAEDAETANTILDEDAGKAPGSEP